MQRAALRALFTSTPQWRSAAREHAVCALDTEPAGTKRQPSVVVVEVVDVSPTTVVDVVVSAMVVVVVVAAPVAMLRMLVIAASTSSICTVNSAAAVRRSVPSSGAMRPATMSPTLDERSDTSTTSATWPAARSANTTHLGDRVFPVVQVGLGLEELGASLGEGDRPAVPVGIDPDHFIAEGDRLILENVERHHE